MKKSVKKTKNAKGTKKIKRNVPVKYIKENLLERPKITNRSFFKEIFEHLFNSAKDELRAYHDNNTKYYNNIPEFAEFIDEYNSTISKLLSKNTKQKSLSLETILKVCDKIGVPISFNYEIGLHKCSYTNKGYLLQEKRNISSNRYRPKEIEKLEVAEIKRKVDNCEPMFYDYEPKIIPISFGACADKIVDMNCDTADKETLKNALAYEKAIKELLIAVHPVNRKTKNSP